MRIRIDTKKFFSYKEQESLKLRNELGYSQNDFLLICVGELNENKRY